jgi:hypothetical protein
MSAKIPSLFGLGLFLCTGCASREFDVYARSDAKERVAVSIDLCKPNGSQSQLFYAELNDGHKFRFRRKLHGENPNVVARFWVMDNKLQPVEVAVVPDRRLILEVDVKDGKVELEREEKEIDKDEKDD